MINLKDANGDWVVLKDTDVYEALAEQNLTVLGLTANEILELKEVYDVRGGSYPITREATNKVFGGSGL